MRLEPRVAGLDRLREHRLGPAEVAARALHDAGVRHEPDALRVVGREQVHGARDEVQRGRSVAAGRRRVGPASPSRSAARRGKRPSRRVEGSELGAVAVRLLEVVAEELVELEHAVAGALLEPGGVALVEVGPRLLRDRLVGGVADERVAETVAALAREHRRSGRISSLRRGVGAARRPPRARRESSSRRTLVEDLPLDRRGLEHRALASARRSRRAARRAWIVGGMSSSASSSSLSATHREHLLEEERIALRGVDDALRAARGDARTRASCSEERRLSLESGSSRTWSR